MLSPIALSVKMTFHGAVELKKFKSSWFMKPALTCSIKSNGTTTSYLQTLVDDKGGVNPNWDFTGDFIFTAKKNDYLLLDVKHHGKYRGTRSVGEASIPLELLLTGDGIGTKIRYPLIRNGNTAGEIIVSHEIKEVVDGVGPDPVIINGGETSQADPAPEHGNTSQTAAAAAENGNANPRRRFSPLSLVADLISIANDVTEMAEGLDED